MLDIKSNREASKYTKYELAKRIAWIFGGLLFRASPRPLFKFRSWLLRRFGAKIGTDVHIYPTALIQFPWQLEIDDFSAIGDSVRIYNLGPIRIGKRATVSQFAHLCGGSHNIETLDMQLVKSPITICDDAWVCADAFVGPGVTVGKCAVIGARAVVTKDVAPYAVVVGNPAKEIRKRELKS